MRGVALIAASLCHPSTVGQLVQIIPKDRTFSQLLAAAFADTQGMSERCTQMHGTLLLNKPFFVLLVLCVPHKSFVFVTAMLITSHLLY